jgi:NTP pyrophosphatase (non-canonical NTP hydrolase)
MIKAYLPKTPERKVVHLMEECGEVIQACAKILRFGLDAEHPVSGMPNRKSLRTELADLRAAVKKVEEIIQ